MKPFDQIALMQLHNTHRTIESRCIECGAVLLVDMGSVIAVHGESATLSRIGYTILCPVCEAAGLLLKEVPVFAGLSVSPRENPASLS